MKKAIWNNATLA